MATPIADGGNYCGPSADDRMTGYGTQFGGTGDPNEAGLPLWPRYDAQTDQVELGHDIKQRPIPHGDRLA